MQNTHNTNGRSLDVYPTLTFGIIKPSIERPFLFYGTTN